jgi:hypothetical protein
MQVFLALNQKYLDLSTQSKKVLRPSTEVVEVLEHLVIEEDRKKE